MTQPSEIPDSSPEEESESRWTLTRVVSYFAIGLIALFVLLFVFALIVALTSDIRSASALFQYIRDLVTIVLSIQVILIISATAILIVQVAWFVNLLRSEVKPIIEDTQDAVRNVRVTTEFVGKQTREPLIKINAFVAGLIAFLRELFRFRRVMRPSDSSARQTEEGPQNE